MKLILDLEYTQPGQLALPIAPYIPSYVGGAGADPLRNKMRTLFSYALGS